MKPDCLKKRVFIAMHYLEIGGAETSLIGLLHSFDYTKYEVDLFLYSHRGELMKYIPKQVHLLPEEKKYKHIEESIRTVLRDWDFSIAFARLWAKVSFLHYSKKNKGAEDAAFFQYVQDAVIPFLPSLHKYGEYDLAISFLAPHRIVLDKVKAKKKVAWIHTDYTKIDIDRDRELPVWGAYDNIISISDEVSCSFLKIFPSLSQKIVLIENILSKEMVTLRAKEQCVDYKSGPNGINLLSVGRFSYAKNYDNVPDICRRIRQQGLNIYWYIIGYGGEENLIREKIKQAGMEQYVLLLGKKENPYPYIKACDIYVQPSRYEGKSVTVREAQLLGKPVVITDYPTAHSQVEHRKDGVIVHLDNEKCARDIVDFLKNSDLQSDISAYLKTNDYANEKEINKLYSLLNLK